jgi:hypothetical protein
MRFRFLPKRLGYGLIIFLALVVVTDLLSCNTRHALLMPHRFSLATSATICFFWQGFKAFFGLADAVQHRVHNLFRYFQI